MIDSVSDRASAPTTRFANIREDEENASISLASRILKRNATSIKSLAARSSRTCSIDGNRSSTGSMLRALPSFQSSRMSLRAEKNFIDKDFPEDPDEEEVFSPEHHEQIVNWLSSQATNGSLQDQMGAGPIQLLKLSGGICNSVYMAQSDSTGHILVIKHCKPFISQDADYSNKDEEVNLEAIQRMETEAAGLELAGRVAPGHVPKLLVHEIVQGGENGFMALSFLKDREMLSEALARGSIYPSLGRDLGAFLAKMVAGGSQQALGPDAFRDLCVTLDASAPVAELMTAHVLYLPFESSHPGNQWPSTSKLNHLVKAEVYGNKDLMDEVRQLRILRSSPPSEQLVFLHTDIWINNILCHTKAAGLLPDHDEPAVNVVDFEFGTMGPSSYDIGHVIGQLILSACLVQAFCDVEESEAAEDGFPIDEASTLWPSIRMRRDQVAWLLSSVSETHEEVVSTLSQVSPLTPLPPLEDILGYAGCCIIRWSIGQFNLFSPYLSPVSVAMSDTVYRAVLIGTTLLRERKRMSISEVLEISSLALKESSQ